MEWQLNPMAYLTGSATLAALSTSKRFDAQYSCLSFQTGSSPGDRVVFPSPPGSSVRMVRKRNRSRPVHENLTIPKQAPHTHVILLIECCLRRVRSVQWKSMFHASWQDASDRFSVGLPKSMKDPRCLLESDNRVTQAGQKKYGTSTSKGADVVCWIRVDASDSCMVHVKLAACAPTTLRSFRIQLQALGCVRHER
jgi:hypothetical protein